MEIAWRYNIATLLISNEPLAFGSTTPNATVKLESARSVCIPTGRPLTCDNLINKKTLSNM
jgi:hypothetical protein